ncbi:uncharacterized protein LOC132706318 [Cylas formicarius]|uniref:uncharacterized protein LOC132706318 n=1 Tax=Cylas formicarius TaxID=197179 RepID=UPI002958A8E9|nr:uncharacterized protein LOC132706318 [Cylas formicarius]
MIVKGAAVILGAILLAQDVISHSYVYGGPGFFGDGYDPCHSKPHPKTLPLVIRPKPLPKPANLVPLAPSGGPCYKKQVIVKPAIVPRPVLRQCAVQKCCNNYAASKVVSSGCCGGYADSVIYQPHHPNPVHHPGCTTIHNLEHKVYDGDYKGRVESKIPADAISVALAYKNAHSFDTVAEDRLQYGFRKLPIEAIKSCEKAVQDEVHEANLYSLNGQVVELKPVKAKSATCNLEEEAEEELLNLEEEEVSEVVHGPNRPSYVELGYRPAKAVKTEFVNVPACQQVVETTSPASCTTPCDDGFQPGTVVYKKVPKFDHIYRERVLDQTSCESAEVPVRYINVPPPPPPPCGCGVKSYYSSSSHSSGSQKHSVVLEKLCP